MSEIILARNNCDDYEDFGASKCPCGYISYEEDCIQIGDFISHPMLWCDECGGRFFLDCEPYENEGHGYEWPGEFDFSRYEIAGKTSLIFPELKNPNQYTCYRVPLCRVLKVAGSNMTEVRSEKPLDQNVLTLLHEKGLYRDQYHPELPTSLNPRFANDTAGLIKLMKKHSVKLYLTDHDSEFAEKHGLPHLCEPDEDSTPTIENTMVDHQSSSFDVNEGLPDWVDVSHDGIYVYCLIEHRGTKRLVHFWGC